MTKRRSDRRRRLRPIAPLLLGVAIVAACIQDSEFALVTGPGGADKAFKALLSALSGTGLPVGTYRANPPPRTPTPTSVQATFTLKGLAQADTGGGYAFWVYNSVTNEFVRRLTGNWLAENPDEKIIFVNEQNVDLILGINDVAVQHRFDVTLSTTPTGWVTDGDMLVITLEGLPGEASPGPIVQWAQIQAAPGDTATLARTGRLKFGNLSADRAYEYVYSGSGVAYFFGDQLRLEVKNLSRPPRGYYYEVWLTGDSNLSVGAITAPFAGNYQSLLDADVQDFPPYVVETFVRDAALLASATALGIEFKDFSGIAISLSPKNRAGLPVSIAMQAGVPEGVLGQ